MKRCGYVTCTGPNGPAGSFVCYHCSAPDPLVNTATGKPCKGKLAAAALAALVHDPEARTVLALRFPHLFARAESALAPFDLSKLFAVGVDHHGL